MDIISTIVNNKIPLKSSFTKNLIEAGSDEVGIGSLAGPIVAAAVILPKDYKSEYIKDSKQLSKSQREILSKIIRKDSISWSISLSSHYEVDKFNSYNAALLAMHRAIDNLNVKPELLLIDGNKYKPNSFIPYHCIIKGDNIFFSIAAASILAKVYRDNIMKKLSSKFPQYGWETNVGYPTKQHKKAIKEFGITPYHRLSYNTN